MKTLVSTLITEERFWEIIEKSDKGFLLEDELRMLSKDELMGYWYWWLYFLEECRVMSLWAVAYTVCGSVSEDSFGYFRQRLVSRGKEIYKKAVKDADSLCDELDDELSGNNVEYFIQQFKIINWLRVISMMSYDERDKIEFDDIPRKHLDLEWFEKSESIEDSLKAICPKTFDKWWGKYLTKKKQ